MKNCKWIALLLCLVLMVSATSALAMKPGTYTGVATGMFDGLTVDVTVSENAIEDIVVTAYNETAPGWPALEKLPKAIVEAQSIAVDAVAGATRSSEGVIKAVTAALEEAGADIAAFSGAVEAAPVVAPDYFPVEDILSPRCHDDNDLCIGRKTGLNGRLPFTPKPLPVRRGIRFLLVFYRVIDNN